MNAPDLYIPLMGAGTYCLLICLASAAQRKFRPDLMTSAVSTAFAAWTAHTVLLKVCSCSFLGQLMRHATFSHIRCARWLCNSHTCIQIDLPSQLTAAMQVGSALQTRYMMCLQARFSFLACTMCFAVQALLYLMGIPSAVPFLEVVSYAGYPFVHVCITAVFGAVFGETCTTCLLQFAYTSCFRLSCSMWPRRRLSCFDVRTQRIAVDAWRCDHTLQGMSAGSYCPEQPTNLAVLSDTGRVAWYVLWGYGALCMAIFTVRTIKRVIFHEARQYSELRIVVNTLDNPFVSLVSLDYDRALGIARCAVAD